MTFLALIEDIINKQMIRISTLENELALLREELKAKNLNKNKEESK